MWREPLKIKALAVLCYRSNPIFSVKNGVFKPFSEGAFGYSNKVVTDMERGISKFKAV
jgi:hypothetical protein